MSILTVPCSGYLFRETLEAADLDPDNLPYGALLGVVDLRGCARTEVVKPRIIGTDEYEFGNFGPDRFAWDYGNPRPLKEPIPYRGMQKLFTVPAELLKEVLTNA